MQLYAIDFAVKPGEIHKLDRITYNPQKITLNQAPWAPRLLQNKAPTQEYTAKSKPKQRILVQIVLKKWLI